MKINLNDATISVIFQRKKERETNIQNTIFKFVFSKIYIKFDTRFYSPISQMSQIVLKELTYFVNVTYKKCKDYHLSSYLFLVKPNKQN